MGLYFDCLIPNRRHKLFKTLSYFNIINSVLYVPQIIEFRDLELFSWLSESNSLSIKDYRNSMVYSCRKGSLGILKYIFKLRNSNVFITYPVIDECIEECVRYDDLDCFKVIYYNFPLNYRFSHILKFVEKCMIKKAYYIVMFARNSFSNVLSERQNNIIDKKIILLSFVLKNRDIGRKIKNTNVCVVDYYNDIQTKF